MHYQTWLRPVTSDELKAYEITGTQKNDPRLEKNFVTEIECNLMLKETKSSVHEVTHYAREDLMLRSCNG